MSTIELTLIAAILICGFSIALIRSLRSPLWAAHLTVAAIWVPLLLWSALPIDTRPLALVFLALGPAVEPADDRRRSLAVPALICVVAALSSFASANVSSILEATVGGLIAVALLYFVRQRSYGPQMINAMSLQGGAIATGAVLYAVSTGRLGRLQFIFPNPNTLSLLLLLLGLAAFITGKRRWVYLPIGATIMLTETRSVMLAVVAGAVFSIARRFEPRLRAIVWTAALGLTLFGPLVFVEFISTETAIEAGGTNVIRTNDSRSAVWSDTIDVLRDANPFIGAGSGGSDLPAHNSVLFSIAEYGLAATVLILAVFASTSRKEAHRSPGVAGVLLVAGLTSGAFEAWFFVATSPYFLLFWIALGNTPTSTKAAASFPSRSLSETATSRQW